MWHGQLESDALVQWGAREGSHIMEFGPKRHWALAR